MAVHYIPPGRCKPVYLLLTCVICFSAWCSVLAAPPSVGNVTTLNVTDTSISVTWNAENLTAYRVIFSNGSVVINQTTASAQYTATGLLPGVTYTITVYSEDANGTSSGVSVTQTTWPSTVTGFRIAAVSYRTVNLTWTFPNDVNRLSYTYTVNVSGFSNKLLSNITTNSVQVTDLSPGENYTFTISTVTSNNFSRKYPDSLQVTTMPSVVTNVNISVSEKYVNLTWTVPPDDNAALYTYNVVMGGAMSKNFTSTGNMYQVIGLSPGQKYTFTIQTVTPNGISSLGSPTQSVTTMPSPVSNVTISDVSETNVTLSWTSPNDSGFAGYTYTVKYMGEYINNNITCPTNRCQVTGLSPGQNYTFTIYTKTPDDVLSSPYNYPTTVTTRPPIVTDFKISGVSEVYVNLTWTSPTNNGSAYYTYMVVAGDANNITCAKSPCQVPGLSPGQNYTFTIFTVTPNGVTSFPYNSPQTATTRPSTVSNLKISGVSEQYVTLTWTKPTDNGAEQYTYTVVVEGLSNNTTCATSPCQVKGLSPGQNYTFTVYTVTPNNVLSLPSNSSQTTTKPTTVTNFQVSAVSTTSVTLTWTIPSDKSSVDYTYRVLVGGDTNKTISYITGDRYQETGLLPGQSYNFTIYTVTPNNVQSSPYLYPETLTTMPNPPGDLVGVTTGSSELFINWTAPGDKNANLYHYNVRWINVNNQYRPTGEQNTGNTNLTIQNLYAGNLYNVTVESVIKNTSSAPSTKYLQTNPVPAESFTVTNITNTQAMLAWTYTGDSNTSQSGYQIQYLLNGNSHTEYTTMTRYTITGLVPGSQYVFSLKTVANNTYPGIANRAASSNMITYSTEISARAETDPNPVGALQCSNIEAYQIKVTFNCPVGNFSSLNVLVNNDQTLSTNTCNQYVLISNLRPANSYKIKIMTLALQKSVETDILTCSTDSTGVIVGSIFGVLLFLLLIGLIVFFVMKKRRSKDQPEGLGTVLKGRRFHSITKEKFREHYDNHHADSDFGFAEEYQELSTVGTTQSKRAAELPDNRAKNRFTNVLPYDHSRVKLSAVDGVSSADYINANYMPGYNSTKEFIASQGPLPNTTADFWRMIWEHHVNTIIMLTNCMENGRTKCDHYWPLDYTPCTYEDITVTVSSETILSEWTIRDFSIKHAKQPGIKYVRHFHYTAWPDHGVPDSTSSIIEFRNLVREHMDQRKSNGPTIVHCSAGVGRTGTLIALDYLIQQMEREHRIGIYGFVEKMRMNRPLMVQTEAQYIFLNKCMLDLIERPVENIYANETGDELIYENASAVRDFQRENV